MPPPPGEAKAEVLDVADERGRRDPSYGARALAPRGRARYAPAVMQAFRAQPPPLVLGPDGVVRVAGTRVQLETLVAAFDAGATAEEIVQQYPALELAATYSVIAYVLSEREAVDGYVAARRAAVDALRADIERGAPSDGLRARLLAHRSRAAAG